MPSPIPLLNNVATSALSYTAPVFNSFKPFLIIIIGFFAGYFILYTIIEYFVAMKERKTEELQGERDFVINIAKKIYEPLYTKEMTEFIKKNKRNLKKVKFRRLN
jgi:hypothetical protein